MVSREIDRRAVLKLATGTVAAGAVGGLAGCNTSGSDNGDGGTTNDGQSNTDDGGSQPSLQGIPNRKIMTATAKFDPLRPKMADMLVEEMKKVGVNFEANPIRYETNIDRIFQVEPDYDMWLVRVTASPTRLDPSFDTYTQFNSKSQHNNGWNWAGYESEEVDFLTNLQKRVPDKNVRQDLIYRIQERLHEDSPMNILVYPQLLQFYRNDNVQYEGPYTPGEGLNSFWAQLNATPKNRDEIRVAWTTQIDKINPLAQQDALDTWWSRLVYSRLTRVGGDGTPTTIDTESMNVLSPTEYEVRLRDDLNWHDGSPVTAEDVKFTYDLYKRQKAPYYNSSLQNISEVTIPEDGVVKITLKEPSAPFVYKGLSGVMLVQKEKWQKLEDEQDTLLKYSLDEQLGSGPFKFVSWNQGGKLVLERNDDYPQPPEIKRLIRVNYDSIELALQAALRNEIDVVPYAVTPNIFDRANGKENIQQVEPVSIGYYILYYNCDKLPFTDPEFRRAMQYVIPREKISDEIFQGYAEPGGSIIAPGNEFWHNTDVKPYPYDIEKAKQILRDAGYTWDSDGNLQFPPGMIGVPSEDEATIPAPDE